MVVYFFELSDVSCDWRSPSACCDRLNVVHQSIRERVRSSQVVKYIGHLKGRGRRGYKISKPLPSYQPEKKAWSWKAAMEPSVYSNNVPCFCITLKNLTITLELGRIRTWRFPAFSALLMELSASLRTLVLTILPNCRFSTRWWEVRYLAQPGEIYVSFRE